MPIEEPLTAFAVIVGLGIGAQWLAWRLNLPSILLLLGSGLAIGPGLQAVSPDVVFGDALLPFVSIAVAIILFEGGMTLDVRELGHHGRVVTLLVSLGALLTWGIASVAARVFLFESWELSLLLGAIVVVTGPTVLLPMLRQIRPNARTSKVLRWEAILIDPIGALLAVTVYEVILAEPGSTISQIVLEAIVLALGVGTLVGVLGGLAIVQLLRRYLLPDYLHVAVTIAIVVSAFVASNAIVGESGLIAVTVMGMTLATQRAVTVRHILEFEENLRTLLISGLFVVLGARLTRTDLAEALTPAALGFILVLIVIARPAAVMLSSLRSKLTVRDRIFLSWVAPRGIVAAAIASVFAFRLVDHFEPIAEPGATVVLAGAGTLVPVTFAVILGTIALYGTTAGPLARRLSITAEGHGVLIVGGGAFAEAVANAFRSIGVRTLVADTSWENVTRMRQRGIDAYYGSVLSEQALLEMDLSGIGTLLTVTRSDVVNAMVAQRFVHEFGRKGVYQVAPSATGARKELAGHLRGRLLIDQTATLQRLEDLLASGSTIKVKRVATEQRLKDLANANGDGFIPIAVLDADGELHIAAPDTQALVSPQDRVVAIVAERTPSEHAARREQKTKGAPVG